MLQTNMIGSSCSTSDTRRITLDTDRVKDHKWQKYGIVITTNSLLYHTKNRSSIEMFLMPHCLNFRFTY
jgi:hypothetical protein